MMVFVWLCFVCFLCAFVCVLLFGFGGFFYFAFPPPPPELNWETKIIWKYQSHTKRFLRTWSESCHRHHQPSKEQFNSITSVLLTAPKDKGSKTLTGMVEIRLKDQYRLSWKDWLGYKTYVGKYNSVFFLWVGLVHYVRIFRDSIAP